MPDRDGKESFLGVIDTSKTDLSKVAAQFRARGLEVTRELEVLGTIVVKGDEAAVRKAAEDIQGLSSLELERTVRTQN